MSTTVQITRLTEPDELLCHYPGQFNPQPCTLYLDTRDGELGCEYNPNPGPPYPTTFDHLYRIILEVGIPCLTADAANALMDEVLPLAQRVIDGADQEWDGNNNVGTFTDDAEQAWNEIVDRCASENFEPSETAAKWHVTDWFAEGDEDTITSLELTADTTDDDLAAKAAEQVELAATATGDVGYAALSHEDTLNYLDSLRHQLRDGIRDELERAAEQLNETQEQRNTLIRRIKGWGDDQDSLRALGHLAGVSHTEIRRILDTES